MNSGYIFTFTALTCSLFIGCNSAALANEGVGVSAKAGTLGAGVELSASLLENTRLRGGFNYLKYSFDSIVSGIDYEFEPQFSSFSLLLDWHPFSGSFFLSGGAYINNNTVGVSGSFDLGRVAPGLSGYGQFADLVSISGDVEFTPVAPYLGLGWRSNNGESGWGVACDFGLMFQGAPDVTNLRVNAPVDVNNIQQVQNFLAEQEQEIEDELSGFQYYPVASFTLSYNF